MMVFPWNGREGKKGYFSPSPGVLLGFRPCVFVLLYGLAERLGQRRGFFRRRVGVDVYQLAADQMLVTAPDFQKELHAGASQPRGAAVDVEDVVVLGGGIEFGSGLDRIQVGAESFDDAVGV